MTDRLEEIKKAGLYNLTLENYCWLIAELEKTRKLIQDQAHDYKILEVDLAEIPERRVGDRRRPVFNPSKGVVL